MTPAVPLLVAAGALANSIKGGRGYLDLETASTLPEVLLSPVRASLSTRIALSTSALGNQSETTAFSAFPISHAPHLSTGQTDRIAQLRYEYYDRGGSANCSALASACVTTTTADDPDFNRDYPAAAFLNSETCHKSCVDPTVGRKR